MNTSFLWVGSLIPLGYFFGGIPIVKENFELVVFGIIGFSLLPVVFTILKEKFGKKEAAVTAASHDSDNGTSH